MSAKIRTVVESTNSKPWGDCYAPQIVLTARMGRLDNVSELNTDYLPFTAEEFKNIYEELSDTFRYPNSYLDVNEVVCRFIRIFYGIEVAHIPTHGYSQGDWGESFIFAPENWKTLTGATNLTERDHNDLCSWIWGDVYEVTEVITPEVSHVETCNLGHEHTTVTTPEETYTSILYGMDEANKFAKENNTEIEEL